MKRIRQPKTGRLASTDEQEIARQWVRLYRKAELSSDGKICLNPDAKPEIQEWFDSKNPEPLLKMLENFVAYGTFKDVGEETAARERFMFYVRYRFARQNGESHATVVEKMAEEWGLSEKTIERHLADSSPGKILEWLDKNKHHE
jgi:hypothetical protein